MFNSLKEKNNENENQKYRSISDAFARFRIMQ